MIDDFSAIGHIQRLSGLSFFPKGDGDEAIAERGELVTALQRVSETSDHAEHIIDTILRQFEEKPRPKDIYDIGGQSANDFRPRRGNGHCDVCEGTCWVPYWVSVTWVGYRSRTTRITKQQYDILQAKPLGGVGKQEVYRMVEACVHCPEGFARKEARSTAEHFEAEKPEKPKRRSKLEPASNLIEMASAGRRGSGEYE